QVACGRGMEVTARLVSLHHPLMVSRKHCVFTRCPPGASPHREPCWSVTDCRSINGVYVNGERIDPGTPHVLSAGDTVQIGVRLESQQSPEFEYRVVRTALRTCLAEPPAPSSSGSPPEKRKREEETRGVGSVLHRPRPFTGKKPRMDAAHSGPSQDSGARELGDAPSRETQESTGDLPRRSNPGTSRSGGGGGEEDDPTQSTLESAAAEKGEGHGGDCESVRSGPAAEPWPSPVGIADEKRGKRWLGAASCEPGKDDVVGVRSEREWRRLQRELAEERERQRQNQLALREQQMQLERLAYGAAAVVRMLAVTLWLLLLLLPPQQEKTEKKQVICSFENVMENELQCIICSELFIQATTLSCAHTFCRNCIEEWLKQKELCPICRASPTSSTPSLVLDNCIARMVESLGQEKKAERDEIPKGHRHRLLGREI
uniref:E3 ubiquitin-protein ligase CHFR n=1 Tax=Petromyzon marinus TaxID=7757 RepID=S4RSQ6_PETMA